MKPKVKLPENFGWNKEGGRPAGESAAVQVSIYAAAA